MAMKFIKKILAETGTKTGYELAKAMTAKYGEFYSPQKVSNWVGAGQREQKGINLTDLCRLFELSGLSGDEFMKMLCSEFLTPKK